MMYRNFSKQFIRLIYLSLFFMLIYSVAFLVFSNNDFISPLVSISSGLIIYILYLYLYYRRLTALFPDYKTASISMTRKDVAVWDSSNEPIQTFTNTLSTQDLLPYFQASSKNMMGSMRKIIFIILVGLLAIEGVFPLLSGNTIGSFFFLYLGMFLILLPVLISPNYLYYLLREDFLQENFEITYELSFFLEGIHGRISNNYESKEYGCVNENLTDVHYHALGFSFMVESDSIGRFIAKDIEQVDEIMVYLNEIEEDNKVVENN